MLNSHFWLRPFLAAIFGMILLSASASAARDGSTDRPGLDYKTIELSAPNPDLCESACKKEGKCRAWTYSWPGSKGPKAMCGLKSGVPAKRSDTCCISGVISTSSPVTRTDDPAPAPVPGKQAVPAKPAPVPVPPKPAVAAKPVPDPVPEKPAVVVNPTPEKPSSQTIVEPLPEPPAPQDDQGRITISPRPKPDQRQLQQDDRDLSEETPRQEQPVPAPVPPKPAVTAKPVPAPVPETPAVVVEPTPEEPSSEKIVEPLPAPPVPQDDQGRITISPRPKPSPQPLQQDDRDLSEEPARQADPDPAKVAACNNYASRALAQNDENNRLNCRLSGSLWGFSRISYYNFCMQNPSSAYNGSRAARDRELDQCKRGFATRGQGREETVLPDLEDSEPEDLANDNSRSGRFCRNFADQSIQQVNQARVSNCGFGGERWSASRLRQARLCARIGPRAATQMLNTRNRQIENCRVAARRFDGPVPLHCRDYARSAVQQAREARRLDCGFGGLRWSRNYDRHLRWCSETSRSKARLEYRRRERMLNRCE